MVAEHSMKKTMVRFAESCVSHNENENAVAQGTLAERDG
jgi:hypothetical protein